MILLDAFKYFAKYPQKKGVLDTFSSGKSPISGYDDLKLYIENLTDHSRIPDITGFVMGAEKEYVKRQINAQTGVFMIFDYDAITSERDKNNSIQDSWMYTITIAKKMSVDSDTMELALHYDQMLEYIRQMIIAISADQAACSWLKQISTRYTIVPFDGKEFSSYGWTILFSRTGADMLNLKILQ